MIKHRMGCFVAFFSLIFYKTIGPPAKCHSKCFRCCIAKKEEMKAGGGVWDWLESPVETHSMFVVFFLHVLLLLLLFFTVWRGGGVNC